MQGTAEGEKNFIHNIWDWNFDAWKFILISGCNGADYSVCHHDDLLGAISCDTVNGEQLEKFSGAPGSFMRHGGEEYTAFLGRHANSKYYQSSCFLNTEAMTEVYLRYQTTCVPFCISCYTPTTCNECKAGYYLNFDVQHCYPCH